MKVEFIGYMHALEESTGASAAELIADLDALPDRIAAMTAGFASDRLRWKPSPDRFSILENVAHVRDLELEATTARIRRVLSEDTPTLENFDGAAVAAASRYNDESFEDALAALTLARRRNVNALRAARAADLHRAATFGAQSVTLLDLLRKLHAHDAEHVAEIEAIVAEGPSR